jgi:hypothetical protein
VYDSCSNEIHMGIVLGEVEAVKDSIPHGLEADISLTHQSRTPPQRTLGCCWNHPTLPDLNPQPFSTGIQ